MDTAIAPSSAIAARYSTVAIVLHWLIAALLIMEVGLGLNMDEAKGSAKYAVFQLHKSIGITILLLVLLRVVWRFRRRPPPLGASGWEKALALVVHGAFYAILLALPVSGWIVVSASKIAVPTLLYGTIPWPHLPGFASMAGTAKAAWHGAGEFVHVNLVTVLYGLFALHLAGALKHHFIDRDGDMARIAPGMRTGSWSDPRLLVIGAAAIVAAVFGLTWRPGPSDRVTVAPPPAAAPELPAIPTPDASPVPTPSASAPAPEAAATAEAEQGVSSWAILPGSSLRFRTTWSGEAITGGFTKFGGDIAFGPDQLDKSAVTITIDTGSVFSGDSERDGTLEGDDWFAVGANRNAVFKATRFSKTGGDRYVASGTLRMKGVTAPISVPFTLRIVDEQATMQGSATIDRLAYKIGEGEFASTAEIPAVVAVQITIKARRIQP